MFDTTVDRLGDALFTRPSRWGVFRLNGHMLAAHSGYNAEHRDAYG